MIDRRTFATLLAGAVATPGMSWGQGAKGKTVLYASTGPELTLFGIDVDDGALVKDIERTGATVVAGARDPQVELVLAQRVAVATAQLRGLDPDRPRHLARSVVLTGQ